MISKLRFSLIAVIMLVLVGFGFQNQANGQVGLNGLFCPAVPDTTGWLMTEIVGFPATSPEPDFTGSVIGTVENSGADAVGGLDWQHTDGFPITNEDSTVTPTNETGSQLVSWWTQEDGRNTYLQVTNSGGGVIGEDDVHVHVRIHNEDCIEIRDFCDVYTPYDTHEYNFSDLVSNGGANIADGNLQGVEGWLVVTAVTPGTCGTASEQAYDHNYLSGQLIVHDSDDYLYGVNTYARQAICFNTDDPVTVNRVPDGDFASGSLGIWTEQLMLGTVIDPLAQFGQNALGAQFAGFAVATTPALGGSGTTYDGGSFGNIADGTLTNNGTTDSSVAIIQSAAINVSANDIAEEGGVLSYNFQLYASDFVPMGGGSGCTNYGAVLLVRDVGGGNGVVQDATCYQANGSGPPPVGAIVSATSPGGKACIVSNTAPGPFPFGINEFQARANPRIGDTLSTGGIAGTYFIHIVAGQNDNGNDVCDGGGNPVGALATNFVLLGENENPQVCTGALNGDPNARLDTIRPSVLSGQFNILPGNDQAGADVVHINFADVYGPPYRPVAAFSNVFVSIFDEDEVDQSCGDATVCFVRLGIDDALVLSENFSPATPTPTPTVQPTTAPPTITPPPTATPTPTGGGGGGSGSCAIAGSPVQLGTALANVLIPLVPVAFAFGVRAVRRRKK